MNSRIKIAALLLLLSSQVALGQKKNLTTRVANTPLISAHGPALPPARAVARVNGSVLTDRDLLREMYAIFPYARQHNGAFPKSMEADIRSGALKMIEFEELVYQEALRRHMTIPAAQLAKAEKLFRARFDTDQQFQNILQIEFNGSRQVLVAKIRRSMLIEALLKADVEGKSAVTPAEVRSYYEKNPTRFQVPDSYAVQTITALPPKNPTPEQLKQVRKRAEDALRQAKATRSYEDFGALAEKISDDDYRVMMGDHKLVPAAQLPPAVLQTAARLKPGEVSDLVPVDQAFTIIRLNAHVPPHLQKFDQIKDSLRQELEQRKVNKLRSDLNARLRKNAKIEEL